MEISREEVVTLIGSVLIAANLTDKDHAEDRVNKRIKYSAIRKRKCNSLKPTRVGTNRFKASKVATWAAVEWPKLNFSSVFLDLEPAHASVTATLGVMSLSAAVRVMPQDLEACQIALRNAWARIDELQANVYAAGEPPA
jgi:hypothetical protein